MSIGWREEVCGVGGGLFLLTTILFMNTLKNYKGSPSSSGNDTSTASASRTGLGIISAGSVVNSVMRGIKKSLVSTRDVIPIKASPRRCRPLPRSVQGTDRTSIIFCGKLGLRANGN